MSVISALRICNGYARENGQIRVKPTKETLFADAPNLNIDYSIKMSENRELWRSRRPSVPCQPVIGGAAVKSVSK